MEVPEIGLQRPPWFYLLLCWWFHVGFMAAWTSRLCGHPFLHLKFPLSFPIKKKKKKEKEGGGGGGEGEKKIIINIQPFLPHTFFRGDHFSLLYSLINAFSYNSSPAL